MGTLMVGQGQSVKVPGVNDAAWTAYNPTVAPISGAYANVTASGAFFAIGKTVFVRISITVTNKGTGDGCIVSLPVTPAGGGNVFSGREIAATGAVWQAFSSTLGYMDVRKYDNSTSLANGWIIQIAGVYEAA
jgi:hypothetical protein